MDEDMKLIQGDCLHELEKIPSASVDCIIIDPPYSTPIITAFGRKKVKNLADLSLQEYFFRGLKKNFERVLKDDGRLFIFCDDKFYPILFAVFYDWLNLQLLIWDKGKIGMGRPIRKQHELIFYCNRGSWEFQQTERSHIPSIIKVKSEPDKLHAAQKPIELLQTIICGFSREGDVILDCFMGSGSTGVAALSKQRKFIGIELSPKYYEISKKRIDEEMEHKSERR